MASVKLLLFCALTCFPASLLGMDSSELENWIEPQNSLDEHFRGASDLQENLEDILKESFMNAGEFVRAAEITNGHPHHRRVNNQKSRSLSMCKTRGFSEASNIIQKRHNVSEALASEIMRSGKISKSLYKELEDLCTKRSRKAELSLRQALNCNDATHSIYRTITGECNNIANQNWGKSEIRYERKLSAIYDDGEGIPRGGLTGAGLPNPRLVSFELRNIDLSPPKHKDHTQMLKAWGQFIDHDTVLTPEEHGVTACCDNGIYSVADASNSANKCLPIQVDASDTFYSQHSVGCLKFIRSLSTCTEESCSSADPREQFNHVTAFIDGSNIYGSTAAQSSSLRSFSGGELAIANTGESGASCPSSCTYPFLPEEDADEHPDAPFIAGDVRVNEQPGLTSMHTMFMRYHNKIAAALTEINSYEDDDEKAFQEARKIVGAVMQHINHKEYLTVLFSTSFLRSNNLNLLSRSHSRAYDSSLNPSQVNVFAAAAYRFGHSLIADILEGDNSTPLPLKDNFFNSIILKSSAFTPSHILKGECSLLSESMDVSMVPAISDFLFSNGDHGSDLMALNINRGRDHGLPPYKAWYEQCNPGSTISSFADLNTIMDPVVAAKLATLYSSVEDIDLFPAGLAENKMSNGLMGPTFSCIIAEQFRKLKLGDRFWYEQKNNAESDFSSSQLLYLRRVTLASVICETTSISSIQKDVFNKVSTNNPLRSCSTIRSQVSLLDDNVISRF